MSKFKPQRIGGAATVPRGRGIWIPGPGVTDAYTGGGGEFGAQILDADRTFSMIREPIAHRVVFTVAHDIYDNWFELKLEGDEKGELSKKFDKWIQAELTRLHAKREFTLASVYERAYGWAITVLGYSDEAKTLRGQLRNPTDLVEMKTYGPRQIDKVDIEKDPKDPRFGLPVMYHINREGTAGHLLVHHSRVIHWVTRRAYPYTPYENRKEWQGLSVLDPIWDDLVTLRNIRWGMGQTMYRYGSGFPVLTFEGATQEQLEDWTEAGKFANISARTYFAGTEKQKIEFIGTAGHQLDPMNYYLPIMENISAGSGIPLAILRGVQAGALTGSEVNQQEYYGLISDEQSAYEDGIRQLIDIIISFAEEGGEKYDYLFDWKGGFELDDEKKARIESLEMDTYVKKAQFMTRNEIRNAMDPNLGDLPPEQGGEEIVGSRGQFEEGESYLVTEARKRSPRSSPR